MLNTPAKGPATHDPILDNNTSRLDSTGHHSNLSQRAILILVCDGQQKRIRVLEEALPRSLGQPPSIQVELIRLINELKGPAVGLVFRKLKLEFSLGLFKKCFD